MKNQEFNAEEILKANADTVIEMNVDDGMIHIRIWNRHYPSTAYDYKNNGGRTQRGGGSRMNFFIAMNPPTVTAQMKQVRVVGNKPVFYDPPKVKEARQLLSGHLAQHKPHSPFTGAISLRVIWLFPKGKSHKNGEWRVTRPDTDNLEKLLKDCMTMVGFWKDDAQVVREYVEKRWSDEPCGIYIEIEELEDKNHVQKQ